MPASKDFDILEMPLDGLAAYWLSLRKLLDAKKGKGVIEEELAATREPFIRFVLQTVFSDLELGLVRTLLQVRRQGLLADYRRKLDLVRVAFCGIAQAENPRVTLVRMDGLFAQAPLAENAIFDLAHGMIEGVAQKGADLPALLGLDHTLKDDRLMVKLLFFAIVARREGKPSLAPFLKHSRFPYCSEGLSLVADGFDMAFIDAHLRGMRDRALSDLRRKLCMACELSLAVRARLPYEDVFRIARAWLP
jgi:hypothetical protein